MRKKKAPLLPNEQLGIFGKSIAQVITLKEREPIAFLSYNRSPNFNYNKAVSFFENLLYEADANIVYSKMTCLADFAFIEAALKLDLCVNIIICSSDDDRKDDLLENISKGEQLLLDYKFNERSECYIYRTNEYLSNTEIADKLHKAYEVNQFLTYRNNAPLKYKHFSIESEIDK